MQPGHQIRSRQSLHYTLETLHALPCGCVTAVYHAMPLDVEVVAVEARGPHCIHAQHQAGRVVGLGRPDE